MKLGLKTTLGALITVIAHVASAPELLAIIPKAAGGWIVSIGALITTLGLRDAIAKNGNGK